MAKKNTREQRILMFLFFSGFVGTNIGKAKTDGSSRLCASADNLTLQRRFPAPANQFPVF